MATNTYRTAQGKMINMDSLRVRNEQAIAVGNMKTNARGDELGPGGIVVRTRDQVMKEYYDTNAVYTKERVDAGRHDSQAARSKEAAVADSTDFPPDVMEQDDQMLDLAEAHPKLRGNLADAVAKTAKVEQKLLTPKKNNGNGPSRI
jgi:hypothetical protein